MNKNDDLTESATALLKEKKFNEIFKLSLIELKPSKKRIIFILMILCITYYPIYFIIKSNETIKIFTQIVELTNGIILTLFGIVFTGYALFQALLGASSMKQMLLSKVGNHSTFKSFNLFFFALNILFLSLILVDFIILLILNSCSVIPISKYFSSKFIIIAENVFILVYMAVILFAITEIKSFITNLYHAFNLSVVSEVINEINDDNTKK